MSANALSHFFTGGATNCRVDFKSREAAMADQFVISRVFMSHRVAGITCRGALGGALAVNNDNPCFRVHFSQ